MATHDRLDGYTVLEGQFGAARPEIKLAFPYFGETIRVHPKATDITWTAFIDSMKDVPADQVNDMEVLDQTMQYIRQQIHPDDWQLFWDTATKNAQNSVDLVALAQDIVAVVSGFPTGQPDGSNSGRRPTDHLSKGGSRRQERRRGKKSKKHNAAPVSAREAAAVRTVAAAASAGRADLALLHLENLEATTGRHLSIVDGHVVSEETHLEPASQTA